MSFRYFSGMQILFNGGNAYERLWKHVDRRYDPSNRFKLPPPQVGTIQQCCTTISCSPVKNSWWISIKIIRGLKLPMDLPWWTSDEAFRNCYVSLLYVNQNPDRSNHKTPKLPWPQQLQTYVGYLMIMARGTWWLLLVDIFFLGAMGFTIDSDSPVSVEFFVLTAVPVNRK